MHLTWGIAGPAWPALLLVMVAAVLWIRRHYRLTEPRVRPARRYLLTTLRSAAVLAALIGFAVPALVKDTIEIRLPEVVVLVEDSASMDIADTPESASRWDRASELAAGVDSLLGLSGRDVAVDFLRGNGLGPTANWLSGADARPVNEGTDLESLVDGINRRWSRRPLRGVILLADGNETVRLGTAAGPGRAAGARTLIVGLGDVEGPPDRFIQDLRYPEVVHAGDEAVVEVVIGSRGSATDAPFVLRLMREGEQIAEVVGRHEAADNLTRVELRLRPEEAGLGVYELSVDPLPGERYRANNRATLALAVRKSRSRLLVLSGRSGWDVRFLAQAAEAGDRLDLDVVHAGPSGPVRNPGARPWTPPRTAADWREWDGVVCIGWSGLAERIEWNSLAEAVAQGMGLLVLAAGQRSDPPPALAGLLPLRPGIDFGGGFRPGGWRISPSPVAVGHPLLDGVSIPVDASRSGEPYWLSPLESVPAVSPLAGATTVLEAVPAPGRAGDSRPLLVSGEIAGIRSAWFGGHPFWELAFWQPPAVIPDDLPHPISRLARNLLVWTAEGDVLAGVSLVGHRNVYAEGERINLEARRRGLTGVGGEAPKVLELRAAADSAGSGGMTFGMTPAVGEPGCSTVLLPPLPPGEYVARATSGRDGRTEGREQTFVVTSHSQEEIQVRQDRRRLRDLAAALGGSYLAGDDPEALAGIGDFISLLDLEPEPVARHSREPLWSGWSILLLTVALLAVEWILRRRWGML